MEVKANLQVGCSGKSPNITPDNANASHIFSPQEFSEDFPQLNTHKEEIYNVLGLATNVNFT